MTSIRKIKRRAHLMWRPNLHDIICRTLRKRMPEIVAAITLHNALYRRLMEKA